MPKSYKITSTEFFDSTAFLNQPVNFTRQMSLNGTVPGPETKVYRAGTEVKVRDYVSYCIDHEYPVNVQGRLYEDGKPFNKFIAKGTIVGYHSAQDATMLLCGKKADILDFCKSTQHSSQLKLGVLQVDMSALQEKLDEVRGVWFRSRGGFIRARGYMGSQIQNTPEFRAAKGEGSISTLSFYFEDSRSGDLHPILVTEDGTVVLQKNYQHTDDEIDFVLYAKAQLLDGISKIVEVGKNRPGITGL